MRPIKGPRSRNSAGSAILDSKAALLRGEANGVMYSRFDADPPTGAANILASDSVVNAKRDGHNAKYLIAIDTAATGGTFAARLWNSFTSGFETITFNPVFTNNVLNIAGTRDDIHNKLEAATRTGVNWPEPQYDGVVDVRVVSAQEIFARQVTLSDGSQPWRYPTAPNTVVFEVTFQGEVHDSYIDLVLSANALTPAPQTVQIIDYQAADSGTTQTDVSLAMQTQGDFTLVWLQHEDAPGTHPGTRIPTTVPPTRTSTTGGSTRASTRPGRGSPTWSTSRATSCPTAARSRARCGTSSFRSTSRCWPAIRGRTRTAC